LAHHIELNGSLTQRIGIGWMGARICGHELRNTTKTTKPRIGGNAYDATLYFGLKPIPKSISHSFTVAPMTLALSSCK
jgi:hypothetical protein